MTAGAVGPAATSQLEMTEGRVVLFFVARARRPFGTPSGFANETKEFHNSLDLAEAIAGGSAASPDETDPKLTPARLFMDMRVLRKTRDSIGFSLEGARQGLDLQLKREEVYFVTRNMAVLRYEIILPSRIPAQDVIWIMDQRLRTHVQENFANKTLLELYGFALQKASREDSYAVLVSSAMHSPTSRSPVEKDELIRDFATTVLGMARGSKLSADYHAGRVQDLLKRNDQGLLKNELILFEHEIALIYNASTIDVERREKYINSLLLAAALMKSGEVLIRRYHGSFRYVDLWAKLSALPKAGLLIGIIALALTASPPLWLYIAVAALVGLAIAPELIVQQLILTYHLRIRRIRGIAWSARIQHFHGAVVHLADRFRVDQGMQQIQRDLQYVAQSLTAAAGVVLAACAIAIGLRYLPL